MKRELLEKLLEMFLLSDSLPKAEGEKSELEERFVIVRCRDAGVHAGYLVSIDGRTVTLKNSRRLWYWESGGGEHTLSGVARHGLVDGKIAGPVDITLTEACEVISTSLEAEESINGYKIHQVS